MASNNGTPSNCAAEVDLDKKTKLPTMTWSQKKKYVYLTIKLADCFDYKLDIKPTTIDFEGVAKGEKYAFKTELFGCINSAKSKHTATGQCVRIELFIDVNEGDKLCKWPRFTKAAIKLPTLKVDMTDMDSDDDDDSAEEVVDSMKEKLELPMKSLGLPEDPRYNFEQAMTEGIGTELSAAARLSSSESDTEKEKGSSDEEKVIRFLPRGRGWRGRGRGRGDVRGRGRGNSIN